MRFLLEQVFVTLKWILRNFTSPSPAFVKRRYLIREGISNATWVETGTYKGDTAKYLSKFTSKVWTIEPQIDLFKKAKIRFQSEPKVNPIFGASEKVLPEVLANISGDVNFWLDGHYSAGVTFKGELETPIEFELKEIAKSIPNLGRICVMVDDVRCFVNENNSWPDFPSLNFLVEWATTNKLKWKIEHDIFTAKS